MQFKPQTLLSLAVLLCLGLLIVPSYAYGTDEDSGCLTLTELDFHDAIKEYDYVLVNFHALWCRYSKKLKPEWKKLVETLKTENSKVKLAKVEAYDEKKLAEEYGVEGYPTIKLFIKGKPHDYHGHRQEANILEFVNRQLKKPLTQVNDGQVIENKLKEYEWIGLLIGETDNQAVLDVAAKQGDVLFLSTSETAIKGKYGNPTDGQLVLVNNITHHYTIYSDALIVDSLNTWIEEHKFPAVPRFSSGTAERVFLSEEPSMILITKGDNSAAETAFKAANKNIGDKIFMTIANYDEEIGRLLAENLGVQASELPAVRIVRADKERIRKYLLEGTITSDSVTSFYNDFKNKKAKRSYLSEAVPTENNDLVKKVVTKTFKDMVLDPTKDVLVQFWAPWCGHCRAMMPVYDNVARKTREVDGFVVAKMDLSVNDVEGFGIDIVEYPTILLFTKTDKQNPIEFKGERNEYIFDKFIRSHATVNLGKMKQPDPFNKNEL
jgi:protein disulfide-isomerase A1